MSCNIFTQMCWQISQTYADVAILLAIVGMIAIGIWHFVLRHAACDATGVMILFVFGWFVETILTIMAIIIWPVTTISMIGAIFLVIGFFMSQCYYHQSNLS